MTYFNQIEVLINRFSDDINCLTKNEFPVPFMKLLKCKSLFPIYSALDCIESPLCFGFSALGWDRNIS